MQHTNQHWNTFIYLSIDDLDEEGPRDRDKPQTTNQPTYSLSNLISVYNGIQLK